MTTPTTTTPRAPRQQGAPAPAAPPADEAALQLAAPAPAATDDDEAPELTERDRDLHAQCEAWVRWTRTRRLFAQPPQLSGTLARLSRRGAGGGGDGPDATCDSSLAAFHLAYLAQPFGTDKQVFDVYYLHRVKPVKAAADQLGISRSTFYSMLSDMRRRIATAAAAVEQGAAEQLQAMVEKRS